VFSQAGPNYFKDIDSDIAHETKIHLQSKTVARNKITKKRCRVSDNNTKYYYGDTIMENHYRGNLYCQ